MKLQKLTCPNCNGMLEMKVQDSSDHIFCPYCGQCFFIDDGKKTYTFNQNINISKNINENKYNHNRYTNDADVINAQNKWKEYKLSFLIPLIVVPVLIALMTLPVLIMDWTEKTAIKDGKICAGSYQDLLDKDYQTVAAHFEAAGFTNIELIDLEDSGLAFWTNGKVEIISIGGNTTFSSTDYFDPDTKVVISYH